MARFKRFLAAMLGPANVGKRMLDTSYRAIACVTVQKDLSFRNGHVEDRVCVNPPDLSLFAAILALLYDDYPLPMGHLQLLTIIELGVIMPNGRYDDSVDKVNYAKVRK